MLLRARCRPEIWKAKEAANKIKQQAANQNPEPDGEKAAQEGKILFADHRVAR